MGREPGISGMPCPQCGSKTEVIDSRPRPSGSIRRRRVCPRKRCGLRFTTVEAVADGRVAGAGSDRVVIAMADETRETLLREIEHVKAIADHARAIIERA